MKPIQIYIYTHIYSFTPSLTTSPHPILTATTTTKQTNPNLTKIICQPQMYVEARKDHTEEGVSYLRNKPQDPLGPPSFGAHTNDGHCTRVSCEYASGIYVCNDNDDAVRVPLGTVADYAQAVLDDPDAGCNFVDKSYEGSGAARPVVWGQAFDVNGWLVLVLSGPFPPPPPPSSHRVM